MQENKYLKRKRNKQRTQQVNQRPPPQWELIIVMLELRESLTGKKTTLELQQRRPQKWDNKVEQKIIVTQGRRNSAGKNTESTNQ